MDKINADSPFVSIENLNKFPIFLWVVLPFLMASTIAPLMSAEAPPRIWIKSKIVVICCMLSEDLNFKNNTDQAFIHLI